ncbi:hypothetical protein PSTEL_19885 [Paenibacillus stellifer]|uniref:Uncharacterized protein n=1 Tax=Paenibacillus stellifer TaxID=169760 RepID=A0A089LU34_9BACL|nr:hypothetical protein PSTEL_19885 [Paenibacillus stellifer]
MVTMSMLLPPQQILASVRVGFQWHLRLRFIQEKCKILTVGMMCLWKEYMDIQLGRENITILVLVLKVNSAAVWSETVIECMEQMSLMLTVDG